MSLNLNLKWLIIELLIIGLIWLIAYLGVRYFTKNPSQQIHISYIRTLVSFSATVISIFIPLVVALIVYLVNKSNSSFTTLVGACICFLIVLVCSIYLTSGILKKANKTEVVTFNYPADYRYKIAFGMVYMYLVFGIGLIITFLFTELDINNQSTHSQVRSTETIYLERSRIYVGDTKSELLDKWGKPDDAHDNFMYYKSKSDSIQFEIRNDTIIKKTSWKIYPLKNSNSFKKN